MGDKIERSSNTESVIFAFGRFQPPTNGHNKLVSVVINKADHEHADHYIVASASCTTEKWIKSKKYKTLAALINSTNLKTNKAYDDIINILCEKDASNENPLSPEQKLYYMKTLFPNAKVVNSADYGGNIFKIVEEFQNVGYTNITLIVGSDRVKTFKNLFKKYNDIVHVSSDGLERDAGNSVEGMSGSKMRAFSYKGKLDEFMAGLKDNHGNYLGAMTDEIATSMYNDIRTAVMHEKLIDHQEQEGKAPIRKRKARSKSDDTKAIKDATASKDSKGAKDSKDSKGAKDATGIVGGKKTYKLRPDERWPYGKNNGPHKNTHKHANANDKAIKDLEDRCSIM